LQIRLNQKSTALNQKVPLAKNEMKKLDDDIEEAIKKVAEKELSIDELQSYLTKCNHDIENLQKSIIEFEKNVSFAKMEETFESNFTKCLDSSSKAFRWIKYISNVFLMFKKEIGIVFDELINFFIKENGGFGFIGKFAVNLKNSGNAIGNLIVNENKQFECYVRSLFRRKTISYDIKYVLNDILGSDLDKEYL
jgi:hypothetical protein